MNLPLSAPWATQTHKKAIMLATFKTCIVKTVISLCILTESNIVYSENRHLRICKKWEVLELSIISYLPQLQYLYNNASNQTRNTAFYRQPQNVIAPLSRASIHNG